MNVHRRDRAKLKQSPPLPPPEDTGEKVLPLMRETSERRYWGDDDDSSFVEREGVECNKRHKLGGSSSSCSSSSMEEIDLELRLGSPAIKVAQIS